MSLSKPSSGRPLAVALSTSLVGLVVAASVLAQEGTGEPAPSPALEGTGDTHPGATDDPDAVPSVDEVMTYLNDLWRSESSYARLSMSVVTESFSRTLELESWTKGEDEALVIIRAPAREAGTATLRTADGLWNYAPRADRLMRIPSGLLADSWMGSHFTNEDLMRESDWSDDFDTELRWTEREGSRYLLAVSTPHANAAVVWTRIDYWLRPDWVPVSAEYYDGDEVVRTMRFTDIRDVDSRPIPMRMEVIPNDEPGESTTVEYLTLDLDAHVDDDVFTQRGLRRAAQR